MHAQLKQTMIENYKTEMQRSTFYAWSKMFCWVSKYLIYKSFFAKLTQQRVILEENSITFWKRNMGVWELILLQILISHMIVLGKPSHTQMYKTSITRPDVGYIGVNVKKIDLTIEYFF